MARLVPHPEAAAAQLARVLRPRPLPDPLPSGNTPSRAEVARRLLEELGVRCDESAVLQDLKGFLLSSPYGTEIVLRHDLGEDERLEVYAHLVAHALLGPDYPDLALSARFEYVLGREPDDRTVHELREENVAAAVARAILEGRLDATPRLVYVRDVGPARGRLSRAVLEGIHRASFALYRRSRRYQRLRSMPVVTALTGRIHSLFGSAA